MTRYRASILAVLVLLSLSYSNRVEAQVFLGTSRPSYEIGEIIFFTLTNATENIITLPNVIGWWYIDEVDGPHVGGCKIGPATYDLRPGGSMIDYWDQRRCSDGTQVGPGIYRIYVAYWDYGLCYPQTCLVSADFGIGMVPVEQTSWGRIKAAYGRD